MQIRQTFYLLLIVVSFLIPKWLVLYFNFGNLNLSSILLLLQDTQYFPLIFSLSEFNFKPTFIEGIEASNIISFPIYGLILHALSYKIFGIISFVFLELIIYFIFFYIFYLTILKIFENSTLSILFCVTILLLLITLRFFFIGGVSDFKILKLLYYNFSENFGSRLPRPLFTGIFFYLFFLLSYNFRENLQKANFYYFLILILILSVFLNSFFFYFINFSIFFIFLIIKNTDKEIFKIYLNNKIKIFKLLIYFIIFSLPFIFQVIFGEIDYSSRIGVINLSFEKKIYLISYFIKNLFRAESLILFSFSSFIFFVTNKKFTFNKRKELNLFFYFIIISMISPLIFFIFSPKIVSIYHFLEILKFSALFYIILFSYFLFFNFFSFLKISKIFSNSIIILTIFVIFIFNIFIENKNLTKAQYTIKSTYDLQNYFEDENLKNTDLKLFTNDIRVMNLWLINKNKNLIISDGFTNSLKNSYIEFVFLNNLKYFGISDRNFKDIISYGQDDFRISIFMRLFTYRYQANSLYTFTEINNYHEKLKEKILKTSPFRPQSQIVPENEKQRLIKLFENLNIDENLAADIIIIKKLGALNKIKINNSNYIMVISNDLYNVFLKKF